MNQIDTIRVPENMRRNPTHSKFTLVFGRRAEYAGNSSRRNLVHAYEEADFKIVTFDSLSEALEHKHDLYVGIRRNQFVDIQGDEIVDDNLFVWVEPTMLSVSENLYEKLKARVALTGPPAKFGQRMSDFHPNALKALVRRSKETSSDHIR